MADLVAWIRTVLVVNIRISIVMLETIQGQVGIYTYIKTDVKLYKAKTEKAKNKLNPQNFIQLYSIILF